MGGWNALRCNGSDAGWKIPAGPPAAFPLTVMLFVRQAVTDAAGPSFFHMTKGDFVDYGYEWFVQGADNTRLSLAVQGVNSAGGGITYSAVGTIVLGEWRCLAFTVDKDGNTEHFASRPNRELASLGTGAGVVTAFTPGAVWIGRDHDTGFSINGALAGVKIWTRKLSKAELSVQSRSIRATVTSGLWASWELKHLGDNRDYSGHGRHLVTASGTLTHEAGPPLGAPGGYNRQLLRAPVVQTTIEPSGIAPTVAFGTPTLSGQIQPSGIGPTVAFGTPTIAAATGTIQPGGIAPTVAFGTPTLSGQIQVTGIGPTAALGSPIITAATTLVYPPAKSANLRHLVDQNGVPFLLNHEAAWSIGSYVSAPLVATYFADLAARKFNGAIIELIERQDTANPTGVNVNGDTPFTGTTGGQPDLSTPRTAYWNHVDYIISKAAQYGIIVLAFPMYVGAVNGRDGWYQALLANSAAKVQAYGDFLGNRYKNNPNIIWVIGGDLSQTSTPTALSSAGYEQLDQLTDSLRAADTNHLVTAHWDRGIYTSEEATPGGQDTGSWLDLNGVYSTKIVDQEANSAYGTSGPIPMYGLEHGYAREASITDAETRAQSYKVACLGGAGVSYGNGAIWNFDGPFSAGTPWYNFLADPSRLDAQRLYEVFSARPFHRLVPGGCVTAGGGTAGNANFVAASATALGDLMVAYVPDAHTGSVTLDMTKLAGLSRGRWLDPRAGTFTDATGTPFANTGTHAFSVPGTNADGKNDWLLVLELGEIKPTGIGPTVAFGTPSLAGSIQPSGIAPTVAFGSPTLSGSIAPAGIAPTVAFGTPQLNGQIQVAGIGPTVAFGTPNITGVLQPPGIAPTVAFGSPTLSGQIAPAGIGPTVAFGVPVIAAADGTIAPGGIAPTVAFGTPSLGGQIAPAGIAPTVAFGVPVILDVSGIAPPGIGPTVAFGSPTVSGTIQPAGIAATVAFGTPALSSVLAPAGIGPTVAFGTPTVSGQIQPAGIAPTVAFGTPALGGSIQPSGIGPTVAFGVPDVSIATGAIAPAGIGPTVAFGSPVLSGFVSPFGIAPTVAFGTPSIFAAVPGGPSSLIVAKGGGGRTSVGVLRGSG